jgi:hypothetical protein
VFDLSGAESALRVHRARHSGSQNREGLTEESSRAVGSAGPLITWRVPSLGRTNVALTRPDCRRGSVPGEQRTYRSGQQPHHAHQADRLRVPTVRPLPHSSAALRRQAQLRTYLLPSLPAEIRWTAKQRLFGRAECAVPRLCASCTIDPRKPPAWSRSLLAHRW